MDNERLNMTDGAYSKAMDINGEEVYTSIAFVSMKTLFERIIQEYPKTKVINATEGGVPIYGAENMSLTEATSFLETDEILMQIEHLINENLNNWSSSTTDYLKFYQELDAVLSINNQRVEFLKSVSEKVNEILTINNVKNYDVFKDRLGVFENQLNLIELYKTVICPSLVGVVSNLYEYYSYNGDEIHLKIEALYNGSLAEVTETQRFALLLKELKEELTNNK